MAAQFLSTDVSHRPYSNPPPVKFAFDGTVRGLNLIALSVAPKSLPGIGVQIAHQNEDTKVLPCLGNGLFIGRDLDFVAANFFPGEIGLSKLEFVLVQLDTGFNSLLVAAKLVVERRGLKCCLPTVEVVEVVESKRLLLL